MSWWASPARRIRRPSWSLCPQNSASSARNSGRWWGTPHRAAGPGARGPALQRRPRPIPRPSCPRPAPSADRLRGAAQPAPPPPSTQVGGVADEGRDVLVGGGPGDGIRARRAGAHSLTALGGDYAHSGAGGCGPGRSGGRGPGWEGGGARSPPP